MGVEQRLSRGALHVPAPRVLFLLFFSRKMKILLREDHCEMASAVSREGRRAT